MDPEVLDAIRSVAQAAATTGLEVVLVGALASQFNVENAPDYPPFRNTNDADFAVAVRDWDAFRRLREELTTEFALDPKIEHRLRRGHVLIDLIPFGPQIAPGGTLTWPDSGFEMTVVGFAEACAAARKPTGEGALPVPVITVPGFVLLKITAFLDRRERSGEDARDIAYWLRNYASGPDDSRRFEMGPPAAPEHDDYETAGAALLGVDVGALVSDQAAALVERFLERSADAYSPFADALAVHHVSEPGDRLRTEFVRLIRAFAKGFRHARTRR